MILNPPFVSHQGQPLAAFVVGDTAVLQSAEAVALTTSIVSAPSGSILTTTDGANSSSIGPFVVAGKYVLSASSSLSGFASTVSIMVWPAATIADAGLLAYPPGAAQIAVNKTTDSKRREILRAIACEIVPGAADSLFVATGFSAALLGGATVDNVRLASYGL